MSTSELKINIVLDKIQEKYPVSIQETVTVNEVGQISLREIVLKLKRKNFNEILDSSISYYHHAKNLYVFGFFIPKTITQNQLIENHSKYSKNIPTNALEKVNGEFNCKLKIRRRIKSSVEHLIDQQNTKFMEELRENQNRKSSKQKEKTIGEVIEKVALWRKLYTGFPDEHGNMVHEELDQAAAQIGVVKKTLDDYLLQIRNGKRHGYNFDKNKENKIGDLRSFVREKKEEEKKKVKKE